MSHTLRHLTLLTAVALGIGIVPVRSASAPPDAATTTCMQHLQAIGRALKAYRRAHRGALPEHLSDLYPGYLKDEAMLHCPADATPGTPSPAGAAMPDPHIAVSYLYEMSADPATYTVSLGPEPDGKLTWYQQKMAQRAHFGDRVPVVRCWHHTNVPAGQTPPVLNLALSGKVFQSVERWEYDAGTVPFLLASLERDLAAGPERVRRRWTAAEIAEYFGSVPVLPALCDRLHASAAKLAALPGSFSQDAAAQSAAVASLYGAAGDMAEAARAYDRALSLPGEHRWIASQMVRQYFAAGQPQEGVMAAEKLQTQEPQNVAYMVLLAMAHGRAGQGDRATEWLHRADQQMAGQPAPDFTLNDAAGRTAHLAELHGRGVLLFFFTPYGDAPAVAKHLESLHQQYGEQELTILALDPSAEHQPAIDFARRTFTYPLLLDASPEFDAYGIYRIPTLILIDPEGKVAARHSGSNPDLATMLAEEVNKAMPGPGWEPIAPGTYLAHHGPVRGGASGIAAAEQAGCGRGSGGSCKPASQIYNSSASRSRPSSSSAWSTRPRWAGSLSHKLAPLGWGSGIQNLPARSSTRPTHCFSGCFSRNASIAICPTSKTTFGSSSGSGARRCGRQSATSRGVGRRSPLSPGPGKHLVIAPK